MPKTSRYRVQVLAMTPLTQQDRRRRWRRSFCPREVHLFRLDLFTWRVKNMADARQYRFSFEEVVTALIKQLDINEGLWALNVNFHLEAKNLRKNANQPQLNPGFFGLIQHIGLARVEKAMPGLTVDAAKVNPKLILRAKGKPN